MLRGSPLGGEWSCVPPEPRCLKYHSCHEAWRGLMLRFGLLICVCLFFLGCALLFAFGSAGSPCFALFMARAAFDKPLLSFFVAGATFGDLKCLILRLRKIWRTFCSSLNLWFLQSRKGKKRCLRPSKGGVARQQGHQSRSCQFSKERLL